MNPFRRLVRWVRKLGKPRKVRRTTAQDLQDMLDLHKGTIRRTRGDFSDLPLFTSQDWKSMVRSGAPETSVLAAKCAASRRFQIQQRVLRELVRRGPMTDEMLVSLKEFEKTPPSSVRSRRAELVRMGLVVHDLGLAAKTRYGGSTRVWRIAIPDERTDPTATIQADYSQLRASPQFELTTSGPTATTTST
jgi:hypothetical protein